MIENRPFENRSAIMRAVCKRPRRYETGRWSITALSLVPNIALGPEARDFSLATGYRCSLQPAANLATSWSLLRAWNGLILSTPDLTWKRLGRDRVLRASRVNEGARIWCEKSASGWKMRILRARDEASRAIAGNRLCSKRERWCWVFRQFGAEIRA